MKRSAPSVVTTTSAAVAPRPRPPSSHRRSSPIPKPWKESRIAMSASTSTTTTTTTTRRRADAPTLSSQALAALQQFLREQNQNQNQSPAEQSEVALVTEDWRLSQFWYDRETAETVADEVLALCSGSPSRVACIACPTLYAYLKRIDPCVSVQLLEYDKRFEQYGSDFTFYDYNKLEELPTEMKHAYQVIVADPPYLSGECLEKVAQTISFLSQSNAYLLLLTGEVQKDRAAELLGLHPCIFRPKHSSKLGNEFRLFTNYDPGTRLGGWEQEK